MSGDTKDSRWPRNLDSERRPAFRIRVPQQRVHRVSMAEKDRRHSLRHVWTSLLSGPLTPQHPVEKPQILELTESRRFRSARRLNQPEKRTAEISLRTLFSASQPFKGDPQMAEKKQCKHVPCTCPVADGEKYCGAVCQAAGETVDIECDCGHPQCAAKLVGHQPSRAAV